MGPCLPWVKISTTCTISMLTKLWKIKILMCWILLNIIKDYWHFESYLGFDLTQVDEIKSKTTPIPGGRAQLSTARWLKMLQRAKKETIHFAKFCQEIGVEIQHFTHFCSNIRVETIQIFQRPGKGGSKWWSICSNLHRVSTLPGLILLIQAWYWPLKPEYSISSIRRVKKCPMFPEMTLAQ